MGAWLCRIWASCACWVLTMTELVTISGADRPWYGPQRPYHPHRSDMHRCKPHECPGHHVLFFDIDGWDMDGLDPWYWCYRNLESGRYATKAAALAAYQANTISWPRDPDWKNKRIAQKYSEFALQRMEDLYG